jgi:hypothetical protein
MRTLRECRKRNKIKNRYIITMAYKTRKIKKVNKRKYFTGLQRNHSITKHKRMYGGDVDVEEEKINEKEANEIFKKIEEQNKVELPDISEIPVVGPVIEKTGDLIEAASVNIIDKAGDLLGVDIDNPGSISEKLDDVKEALGDPENLEKLKDIAGEAGKIGEVAVVAFQPAAEKFVETTLPVVTDGFNKAVKGVVATGVNLAEDVAGPFIGIPRTLLSAATAFNASVSAGSELVKGASEAIQGSQENFERLMDKAKMPEVPSMKMPSVKMPEVKMPEVKMPEVKMPEVKMPEIKKPEMPNINYNIPNVSSYSDPMKKLQRDAQMVGGRIKKSQLEFLSPFVNRAQIFKQYGGKWNTKKHRNRNRNRNGKTARRK